MLSQDIRSTIRAYLLEDDDDGTQSGNLYFEFYFSSKKLNSDNVLAFLSRVLPDSSPSDPTSLDDDGLAVRISGAPILFWEVRENLWFVTYSSSSLDKKYRNKLSDSHKKIGWILPSQFDSDVVDEIYHEFSPEDENVNIERTWDPYWIYERSSDIPENLSNYYHDNIEEFVQKEIEFNVKTPGWLVDTAFNQGVQEELLNKSEISKSRFTYQPDQASQTASDGGVASADFSSKVTVRQRGEVVHRSGVPDATFSLIDEMGIHDDLFQELSSIVPERQSHQRSNGVIEIDSFQAGGSLEIVFKNKDFNEEASITLSNLLSVGQDDVDLHGVIEWRDDLEFLAETYTPFDQGEYRILFTHTDEEEEGERLPKLEISPRSATTPGIVYLFRKLKEKFDPRIEYEIHPANPEVAQ